MMRVRSQSVALALVGSERKAGKSQRKVVLSCRLLSVELCNTGHASLSVFAVLRSHA